MKKLLFIYNPMSGKGRVADCLGDMLNIFPVRLAGHRLSYPV